MNKFVEESAFVIVDSFERLRLDAAATQFLEGYRLKRE